MRYAVAGAPRDPRYHPAWRPRSTARSLAGCDGPDPSGSTGPVARLFFRRLTGDGRVNAFRCSTLPDPGVTPPPTNLVGVIRIELDKPTLARTRIAISPLWETICSLYLLARHPGEAPWPYDSWARHARAVLAALPPDAPIRIFLANHHRSPDFLSPVPPTACPAIDDELALLRATPADVVEAQLPRYPDLADDGWLRPFRDDRVAAFGALADDIAAYWAAGLALVTLLAEAEPTRSTA